MIIQRASRTRSAFTLIELVISAALMAIILTSSYVCLRAAFSGQKLVNARVEVIQNARVAMSMMSADLRSACPLSKDYDFLGMHRMIEEAEADNLDFGTHHYTPQRRRESDFCEMSYFVNKNKQSGKLELWRRRDASPDLDPLSGGSRELIAEGLRGLKLEFYDGLDWYDEWGDPSGHQKGRTSFKPAPNLTGLPEAVRITLYLDPDPASKPKEKSSVNDDQEPPLVFQTTVRLELADLAQQSSTSASANGTNSSPADASQSPAGATGGLTP